MQTGVEKGKGNGTDTGGVPKPERRRTLLIVDDEEGPRQSLRLIFEDHYDVVLAAGGQEALAVARKRRVDGALVDFLMGDLSGTEVLEQLKEIDPAIEVIILTGHASLDSARAAVRLGACEYLTKPYEVSEIVRSVTRMMERRGLAERAESTLDRLQQLEREAELLRGQLAAGGGGGGDSVGQVCDEINRPMTLIVGILAILTRRLSGRERIDGEAIEDFRERLQVLNREADEVIDRVQHLMKRVRREPEGEGNSGIGQVLRELEGVSASLQAPPPPGGPQTLEQMERQMVADALRRRQGNKLMAAKDLGITRQTLYNKIRAYGLESTL
jgi:DNA-binding NtrC family response regulator